MMKKSIFIVWGSSYIFCKILFGIIEIIIETFRFTGRPPFRGKTLQDLLEKNKMGKIKFHNSDWAFYDESAKKLTKKMLRKEPEKRIDLIDVKLSKWVQTFKSSSIERKLSAKKIFRNKSVDFSKKNQVLPHFSSKKYISVETNVNEFNMEKNDEEEIYVDDEGKIYSKPDKYSIVPRLFHNDLDDRLQGKKIQSSLSPIHMNFDNFSVIFLSLISYNFEKVSSFLLCMSDHPSSSGNTSKISKQSISSKKKKSIFSAECIIKHYKSASLTKERKEPSIDHFLEQDLNDLLTDKMMDLKGAHQSGILDFRLQQEKSQEIGVKTTSCQSCDTRRQNDLRLNEIVPNLFSLRFKRKYF